MDAVPEDHPETTTDFTSVAYRPFRRPRYWTASYYDGEETILPKRRDAFRSLKRNRAHKIAKGNMPANAERMELVEISRREFHRWRSGVASAIE